MTRKELIGLKTKQLTNQPTNVLGVIVENADCNSGKG